MPAVGDAVKVYWNTHRRCFSLQDSERVRAYSDSMLLADVSFHVGRTGRRRVLVSRRKNVHAKVHGTIVGLLTGGGRQVEVRYDPYVCGFFYSPENPNDEVIGGQWCRLAVVDEHPQILVINPVFRTQTMAHSEHQMDMRPTPPDDLYADDQDGLGSFALQPNFSGEQFGKVVCYPVIVEAWDQVMSGGQAKRNYLTTFDEAERKTISRYRSKFHRWHLVSGTPKRVLLKLPTLELLIRAVNFFADPKADHYRTER